MARERRGAAFVDDEEEQEEATHFINKDICSYTLQFCILKNVFFFFIVIGGLILLTEVSYKLNLFTDSVRVAYLN